MLSIGGSSYLVSRRNVQAVNPAEVINKIKRIEKDVSESGTSSTVTSHNLVMNTLKFTRPPKTLTINVGTTPTLILRPPHVLPYIFANPSLSVGVTASTILIGSAGPIYQTVSASGNTQASSLGVSSYAETHVHLRINAINAGSPSLNIYTQSKDPGSEEWFDIQQLFSGIGAIGNHYASLGNNGIVTDFAVRWDGTLDGSNNLDAILTVTLKGGTEKAAGGLARTVYIGGPDVSSSNGYPIFEGQTTQPIELAPDMALYAISSIATTIKMFII